MKRWFVFCNGNLLLEKKEDGSYDIPVSSTPPVATDDDTQIIEVEPLDDSLPAKVCTYSTHNVQDSALEPCMLRSSYYKLPEQLYILAGKCAEMVYWDENTKYCGHCGAPMKFDTRNSKCCTRCGRMIWPLLSTAIIVLVNRGNKLLLIQAKNFKRDFFGCVAGFVETGETLEEAVKREVMEETGIKIKNIRYFKSQPWPYPCGLMVGFYADYESGEIKLQLSELSRGGWFDKDNLPTLPEKLSIARMLIDNWLKEHHVETKEV